MLIQFTIENHRSIRDNAVISFAASKDTSLASCLIHPDDKRTLLPVLAIYGANAAGKSNVLHALITMQDMIVVRPPNCPRGRSCLGTLRRDRNKPTSFEAVYYYDGIRYAYVLFRLKENLQ